TIVHILAPSLASQSRVTGEVGLGERREDADPGAVGVGFVWKDEGVLAEIELASDRLHLGSRQSPRVGQDGERIAGERRGGEDIDNVEAPAHRSTPSALGDHVDLDAGAERQGGRAYGRASWEGFGEMAGVDGVHG